MPSATAHRQLWQRLLDVALFLTTVAAVMLTFRRGLPEWLHLGVLLLFITLFAVRWYVASDRRAYLRSNWLDLLLIVLLASPVLRLIMALKIVGFAPAVRVGALIRAHKAALLKLLILSTESIPAALTIIFGMAFLFGVCAYLFEHGSNPGFATVADSLWWALVTLTTVGYGDIVPQTAGGRVVATMTMIFGIAVYSLVIANVTRFVEQAGHAAKGVETRAGGEDQSSIR